MATNNQQTQQQKPKEKLHDLMVEIFGMIEELEIPEGKYLKFADKFKGMSDLVRKLPEIQQQLQTNTYYRDYVRPATRTPLQRLRLTEAQKRTHPDYRQCNCNRWVHKDELLNHMETQVHNQKRRIIRYAGLGMSETAIQEAIRKEVFLFSIQNEISKGGAVAELQVSRHTTLLESIRNNSISG